MHWPAKTPNTDHHRLSIFTVLGLLGWDIFSLLLETQWE